MAYGTGKQLSIKDALKGIEIAPTTKPKRFEWGVVEYQTPNNETRWRYHNTDIVTLTKTGDIILNSGGFRTMTTKEKTNNILTHIGQRLSYRRWFIHQANGLWTVSNRQDGLHVPYFDGLNLSKANDLETQIEAQKAQLEQIKLRKAILEYSKLYTLESALPDGKATEGDCWLCCGIAHNEREHLLAHIKEGYVMTHLACRALEANGYSPTEYMFQVRMDAVQRSVAKYLYKALGV